MTSGTPRGKGLGRALTGPLRAAGISLLACLVTLGALVAWTTAGKAGSPAALRVQDGRIFVPQNPEATAAFFTIVNSGRSGDQLTGVTAPTGHRAMLSECVENGPGTRGMKMVSAVAIPAGGSLRMTADTMDIMIKPPPRISPGDRLTFTLHFRDNPPITVEALAIRPGQ
ncbi:copper chaperone PCu(A)C [Streptomyces sp. LZ34]